MKRLFTIISVVFMSLMAVSCYDDSALWDSVNEFEQRIKTLESKCQELNTNIKSLQDLIGASQTGDVITSVTPLKEGDAEIGYTITFASGKTINVYHGEDGQDGQAPQIGAAAEDGVLYWTLGGEWLLDAEGNKIPVAGKDGIAPQLKIENGEWYVSYDGETWTLLGTFATESDSALFEEITVDENYVYFTLATGETITVARVKSFDIVFNKTDVAFFPGEECVVEYELIGADEYAQVKAFGPTDWTVFVEEGETPSKGVIKVTSPLVFEDGNVTVLVSDGRSKTFMRTLTFEAGALIASVYTYNVDADVTTLDINFSTNLNYWVYTAADWITVPDLTKSELRDETVTLTLAENTTKEQRSASVYIVSMNDYVIQEFVVYQFGVPYDAWYIVGGFNDWTCADEDYKMTREDDMFVYKNFETTGTELKFNIGSWDVERTGRFAAADYSSILLSYGDNMEIPAGTYDIYMDKNAFTVYFMTAGKTPADIAESFVLESGKYWIVAGGQWSGFAQVVAGPIPEEKAYGYLPGEVPSVNEWDGLSSSMANAYTFTALEDGGYTIQDSYGRYLYLKQDYDSYNVSADLPAEAYIWDLYLNKYNYMQIKNRDKEKAVMFDTQYNTFGCYAGYTDTRFLPYLVKAEDTEDEGLVASEWGVVGQVNGWNAPDITMYKTETEGLFVAYNVAMPDGGFKIRANGEWNDAANYGLATAGTAEVDHYYALVCGGGSKDITLAAGNYDIWFDLTNSKVYVMTPGKSISEAEDGMTEMPVVGESWYLVGSFNSWAAGDANYTMSEEDDWYVYKNFVTDGTLEVKFNAGSWDINRGGDFVAVNEPMAAKNGGNNIIPAAGTYDVYMDKDANVIYFMASGLKPGEIPGKEAVTIWTGEFDNTEWQGNQDLAWGGYDWSARKPGDVLRIYGHPTETALTGGWWSLHLRVGDNWGALNGVLEQYDNPYVVSVILTQEIIDHLVSANGLVMTGTGFVVTKVDIYKEVVVEEESDYVNNIVTNSGFEDGTTGWTGLWGKYTYDYADGRNGGSSLHFTLTDECVNFWDAQLFWTLDSYLEAGVTYAYEFYVKSDSDLSVQFIGQNVDYSGIYKDTFTAGADWTLCKGEFTYAEGDTENIERVGIQFGKENAGGAQFWIDDFKFGTKKGAATEPETGIEIGEDVITEAYVLDLTTDNGFESQAIVDGNGPLTIGKFTFGDNSELDGKRFKHKGASKVGDDGIPTNRYVSFKIAEAGTITHKVISGSSSAADREYVIVLVTNAGGVKTVTELYKEYAPTSSSADPVTTEVTADMLYGITEAAQVYIYTLANCNTYAAGFTPAE